MSSSALANFFIEQANNAGIEMSHLKLQKLMFIGFGWVYALTNEDLIPTEDFEAWPYGPVLPSIYHERKHFGNKAFTNTSVEFDYTGGTNTYYSPKISNNRILRILEKVWNTHKLLSSSQLVELSHKENGPWKKTFERDSNKIDKGEISEYYTQFIKGLL
jgi:uncharacterized phage-associated protein